MDNNSAVSKWYPFLWKIQQQQTNYYGNYTDDSLDFLHSIRFDSTWVYKKNDTYVQLQGISPRKLVFFVSTQMRPSAATHQTFATFSFVQPYGCCVFGSMKSISGSGHRYCPTRNWLQSTSADLTTISYKSDNRMRAITAELYLIVNTPLPAKKSNLISFIFVPTHLRIAAFNELSCVFGKANEDPKFFETLFTDLGFSHTMNFVFLRFWSEYEMLFSFFAVFMCMLYVCVCVCCKS